MADDLLMDSVIALTKGFDRMVKTLDAHNDALADILKSLTALGECMGKNSDNIAEIARQASHEIENNRRMAYTIRLEDHCKEN